jgi:hypothetical protein
MERYEIASRELADPAFERLLDDVQTPDQEA